MKILDVLVDSFNKCLSLERNKLGIKNNDRLIGKYEEVIVPTFVKNYYTFRYTIYYYNTETKNSIVVGSIEVTFNVSLTERSDIELYLIDKVNTMLFDITVSKTFDLILKGNYNGEGV